MNSSLKELQTRRGKLQAERDRLAHEAKDAQRALADCERRLREAEQALQAVPRELQVSEHAILRFLERHMGLCLDGIKQEIASEVAPLIDQLGNGKYPIKKSGLRAVVRDRVVVTVE